jgi:hypothetical protein
MNPGVQVLNDRTTEALTKVRKLTDEALESFCERAIVHAREIVPVLTGNLKKSLDFDKHPSPTTGETWFRLFSQTGYGAYVELGAGNRTPKPYMAPAILETIEEWSIRGKL